MKYNHYAWVLGLFVILIGCEKKKSTKPNVIILLTDDQGYGDLSCHGNPDVKTPNLDAMYKESIRLTDFHVSSVCTPSRSQLLTGLDAVRNGASGVKGSIATIFHTYKDTLGKESKIHLLPEFFKANGYSTAHFGKWHLGDGTTYRSMDRGFDETLTFPGASIWQSPNYWNNDCFDDVQLRNGKEEKTKGYYTDVYFEESIKFIKNEAAKKTPFFVYLPTGAMHTPQFVPEKYSKPYRYLPKLTAQFYGMVANFDENVGRLESTLTDLGIKDNTIVIYLSDNGGTLGVDFYNAGMRGSKGSLYEGGHRVSCFIRWKDGIPNLGRDVTELTLVQDLLPTLIDFCQLDMPWEQKFDGLSLKKHLLEGKQDFSKRISVVQYVHRKKLEDFTVLKNKWRLINNKELYNVKNDIGQTKNVIQEFPEIAKELGTYYKAWKKSVQPSEAKRTTLKAGLVNQKTVQLSCFDWVAEKIEGKGNASQMMDIRQGSSIKGPWHVEFVEDAIYEFTFRRWHKAANTEISKGLPPYFTEFSKQIGLTEVTDNSGDYQIWKTLCKDGIYPKGKALAITQGQFIVNGIKDSYVEILPTDEKIVIRKFIKKGIYDVEFNFLDAQAQILCGAYYGEINRIWNN
ncbi:arylsulfatase [Flavicella sediminum]|uniref:arylsulfatase n=1 Tax=Flavicella sediminum TaxID=2585141 RepID=UPI0011223490|nr:arylsulfatase [Flavicella sediminum]